MKIYFLSEWRQLILLAMLLVTALGCQRDDDTVATPKTITDQILEDDQFSLLRAAVLHAEVGDALKGTNLTLFAPNNAAFQASGLTGEADIRAFPKEQMRSLLLYHVLYGVVRSTDAQIRPNAYTSVQTANGQSAVLNPVYGALHINNATVTQADGEVANGVVHVIDRLLLPATTTVLTLIQRNPNLTFLSAAIRRVGSTNPALTAALSATTTGSAVTVLAPSDDAFRASANYKTIAAIETANQQALARVLSYHAGQGLRFAWTLRANSTAATSTWDTLLGTNVVVGTNGPAITVKGVRNATPATIKQADLPATNGVVHIIDQVLQP